eukprot:scaffold85766_cov18-Tisochrysis_lutea.AAC.1
MESAHALSSSYAFFHRCRLLANFAYEEHIRSNIKAYLCKGAGHVHSNHHHQSADLAPSTAQMEWYVHWHPPITCSRSVEGHVQSGLVGARGATRVQCLAAEAVLSSNFHASLFLQTMYKAAQMELAVLHRLGTADQENRKHCIRLLRYFEYRNHMCLVSACACDQYFSGGSSKDMVPS